MQAYGFDTRALNFNRRLSWIEDELYAKNQIWTSIHCSWKEIKYGIPQGSILGPIFFNINLCDMFFFMKDVDIISFADNNTSYMWTNNSTSLGKDLEDSSCSIFKVSENLFKQNRSMLKNMTVLLYTYFFNISLNVLRPNFFNICNLTFLHCPNIGKIRVKVGPKTNYFSYFMSSCINRIAVFNNFFSLICSQPRDKQNSARDFFRFEYFLNNQLLIALMETTLSKLVELLL